MKNKRLINLIIRTSLIQMDYNHSIDLALIYLNIRNLQNEPLFSIKPHILAFPVLKIATI